MLRLDEPTSALDPDLVGEVLEVIQRLAINDGLTMILSSHQLRFADEARDRAVFLSVERSSRKGRPQKCSRDRVIH